MFNSDRLYYRKLSQLDFNFYYNLLSNKEVMRYAYLNAFESIKEAENAFHKILELQENDEEGTQYITLLKESHTAIGIVDYEVLLKNHTGGICEIGYFILPDYWRKGYAKEMGSALIDYLFQNENVHKIIARCHKDNSASEVVMQKLGMKMEAVLKLERYKDGKWADECRYAILREDYLRGLDAGIKL